MRAFLLLTIAILVYGSLFPFHFQATARGANPVLTVLDGWPHEWNRFILRDVFLNVILYAPVGLGTAWLFRQRYSPTVSAAAAILAAFALSVTMELLQVYEPMRDPSSLDVLSNTAGGALGALLAWPAERRLRRLMRAPSRGSRAAGAILMSVWVLQTFYPFFPAIGRAHLYDRLDRFLHALNPPLVETWLGAGEWFAVGLALEAMFAGMRTTWLAGLMVFSLAAQLATGDHFLTGSQIVAAGVALILWHVSRGGSRAKWCICLLGSGIALRELQPFYFLSVPQNFSWIPFAATLESVRTNAILIIARKAFDYGAMALALHSIGWSYLRAGIVLAAALAMGEAIQMYLPGRTPEIADPLLALMMVAMLRKVEK